MTQRRIDGKGEATYMKKCPHCKEWKPLIEYGKDKNRPDGLNGYCKICAAEKGREMDRKIKKRAFEHLGGIICSKCGFDDIRALQVDHIEGGGKKEYHGSENPLGFGKHFYYHILRMTKEEAREKHQVLCANCNWIKRDENNECARN